jgi:hypothetical protein
VGVEAVRLRGRAGGLRTLAGTPRWLCDVLVGSGVILALAAPAIFTRSGFVDDWVNHLWLTWLQSREISATGVPSLFLNAEPMGVFYPNYAFYGGSIYALGGYLTAATGAPIAVFVAMIVAAFASAYGGTLWIARQAGVNGVAAHMPAAIVVSGAYYLSLAYGRGSWPELIATSALPVVLAAAIRILRRGYSTGSIAALALATVVWSGSHNVSLLWGTVFLAAVTIVLVVAFLPDVTMVTVRWAGIVGGVMLGAVMVNGWFLYPDLAYGLHTQIAQFKAIDPAVSAIFSRASVVFNPFRARATGATYLRSHFTELPVFVIGWLTVTVLVLVRRGWPRPLRRAFFVLAAITVALVWLLLDESIWHRLPSLLSVIQFTFRLETYIVLGIAGLVIILLRALAGIDRARRTVLVGALGATALLGLALAVWQVWNSDAWYYPDSPRYLANRSSVLRYPHQTPPTWYEIGQFRDVSEQVVPTEGAVHLDPAAIHGESTTQEVSIPPGEGPLASNIAASANLVSVDGLRIAGRTTTGFLALARPTDGSSTARVTVRTANTTPVQLGPVVSVLGLVGLAAALAGSFAATRRRRVQARRASS